MTKISVIAFANAIKVGTGQNDIILAEREGRQFFEITLLDAVRIRVKCLTSGDVTHTSLFNTKWWKEVECAEPQEKTAPKKPVSKKL